MRKINNILASSLPRGRRWGWSWRAAAEEPHRLKQAPWVNCVFAFRLMNELKNWNEWIIISQDKRRIKCSNLLIRRVESLAGFVKRKTSSVGGCVEQESSLVQTVKNADDESSASAPSPAIAAIEFNSRNARPDETRPARDAGNASETNETQLKLCWRCLEILFATKLKSLSRTASQTSIQIQHSSTSTPHTRPYDTVYPRGWVLLIMKF